MLSKIFEADLLRICNILQYSEDTPLQVEQTLAKLASHFFNPHPEVRRAQNSIQSERFTWVSYCDDCDYLLLDCECPVFGGYDISCLKNLSTFLQSS